MARRRKGKLDCADCGMYVKAGWGVTVERDGRAARLCPRCLKKHRKKGAEG